MLLIILEALLALLLLLFMVWWTMFSGRRQGELKSEPPQAKTESGSSVQPAANPAAEQDRPALQARADDGP